MYVTNIKKTICFRPKDQNKTETFEAKHSQFQIICIISTYLIEMIPQKFYYQALTIKNYVVLLHCLSKTPCRKNNKEKKSA